MPQTQHKKLHADSQLSLSLAPPRIQDCLRDAHNRPLAGFKDGGKMVSHRVPPSELWGYPFTEIGQTYTSYCALVFDCDDPDATELAFYDKTFPRPSWMVQNQENRHLHVGYGLVLPVHRYEAAKPKPLQTLRRVAEYGTRALNADPGFSGEGKREQGRARLRSGTRRRSLRALRQPHLHHEFPPRTAHPS